MFKSLLVMLSISLFCFLLVFYLAKKYYRKLMWGVADSEINYGFKNTKLRKLPLLNLNLLLKEFKTVFRNYNHSFSFFYHWACNTTYCVSFKQSFVRVQFCKNQHFDLSTIKSFSLTYFYHFNNFIFRNHNYKRRTKFFAYKIFAD